MLALVLLVPSRQVLEDSDKAKGLGAVADACAAVVAAGADAGADFCLDGGAVGISDEAGCSGAEVVVATASAEPVPPAPRLPSSRRGRLEPEAATEPS